MFDTNIIFQLLAVCTDQTYIQWVTLYNNGLVDEQDIVEYICTDD